jgi:hypothetical protein
MLLSRVNDSVSLGRFSEATSRFETKVWSVSRLDERLLSAYSGDKANERPRQFKLDEQIYEIDALYP